MEYPQDGTLPQPETAEAVSSTQQVINLTGIVKNFGETRALRGASFSANAGEIHAIVGENGSGKSTLAKVMSGVVIPDQGEVSLLGKTPTEPMQAAHIGIATVFQEVLVAEGLSIVDNVYIGKQGTWRYPISRKQQAERAQELLEELTGHDIDPHAAVDTLSLADRQWVTIARALVREPSIVIFDESTAALDLSGARRLYGLMQELRDAGACVIIVTHRLIELTTFADRATVLRDGVDVGVLNAEEITEERLIELMTGVDDGHAGAEKRRHLSGLDAEQVPLLVAEDVVTAPGVEPSSFTLHAGEIVGFAGLEGQGQAEFLKGLTGVGRFAEGTPQILQCGTMLPVGDLAEAENAGVSYISGDRRREGIFPNMSIFENFAMPLYRSHRSGPFIDRRAVGALYRRMAETLKLRAGVSSNFIGSLSGGNQQKVLIGRELAREPKVVALNDPARGVDIGTKRELYAQLDALAAGGTGVIYLSSEIDELIGLCDRVAVFRDGRLFGWLEGKQITNDRVLAAMFGHLESGFDVDEAYGETSREE
ncbi:MAG: sugar ABC transporter ATP-binding protein [Leucobacter sp.]